MLMEADELSEMKNLIAVARKRELFFGLCLGKKPEDSVLYMHRKKSPEILARNAKKAGDTPKVTSGVVSVKGKVMSLTCQDDIPAGMARAMRLFLTRNDFKMKVVILDTEGQLIESDGDDEDEAQLDGAEADDGDDEAFQASGDQEEDEDDEDQSPAEDPLAAEWHEAESELSQPVEAYIRAGHEKSPVVEKVWAGALQAAGKGDYKTALDVARRIQPLVTAGEDDGGAEQREEQSPEAAAWAKLQGPLGDLYARAVAHNPPTRTKLEAAWAMAVEKADSGDFKTALTIAAKLKPALEAAADAGPAETEIPKDVVAFQKSRILWSNTRAKMLSEMKKLESAIISACAGDEDLSAVVAEVSNLTRRLDVFDQRLEDILDRITNTPDGPARETLKSDAKAAIEAYKQALGDDFFNDVDANNGFVNVAVASTAQKSLDAISKSLGA
ncbi:hypothetical protein [Ostreiculturibacter nitratireducens]|uniref:hypothetical protein n=1 Tax=Ostreiculturibacter nitratireducens TaxID=3075226 RepID=UPI0031B5AB7D